MDFDAHDDDGERARKLVFAAFALLVRHPQLFVVLATSGSGGWHLFVFTREFHPPRRLEPAFETGGDDHRGKHSKR